MPGQGSESGSRGNSDENISRRNFLRSAVAIGGSTALSACLEREEDGPSPPPRSNNGTAEGTQSESVAEPQETVFAYSDADVSQHAWWEYVPKDEKGIPKQPTHHLLLFWNYSGGVPTNKHRVRLEKSLSELERTYEWSNEGLLFTVGYSPYYFDMFDENLPDNVDLPKPEPLAPFESPELDEYDVAMHFASDYASAVLGAEEALSGNREEINGVDVDADISEVLDKQERRTGFVGEGMPAKNQDVEGIPDSNPVEEGAPMFMGFDSRNGLTKEHPQYNSAEEPIASNEQSEVGVEIEDGPFQYGTTQQISKLHLQLDDWYSDNNLSERTHRMFSPQQETTSSNMSKFGKDAKVPGSFPEGITKQDAQEYGLVGHSTKLGRAKDEMGLSPILRRDFNSTDDGHAGLHFVSLQRGVQDFVEVREAMNGTELADEYDEIGERENNGILEFIRVKNRGNYLIPPKRQRSLPTPNPGK